LLDALLRRPANGPRVPLTYETLAMLLLILLSVEMRLAVRVALLCVRLLLVRGQRARALGWPWRRR
jgi:hypothetical protein